MHIEIDQSGKIEDTSHDTVIAFSDGKFGSIRIAARDKREVQKIFRRIGKPHIFVYRLFAILIFLLLRHELRSIMVMRIDEEYSGHNALIKNLLMQEIRKAYPQFPRERITFARIGKKSRAHYLAYGVAIGKRQPDINVTAKQVLRFVVK